MQLTIGRFEGVASPLDLIAKIKESGDFLDTAAEKQLSGGEVVIGELNDDEKALDTARYLVMNENNAIANVAPFFGGDFETTAQKVALLGRWHEVLDNLFWVTVRTRFDEEISRDDVSGIGIRPGHRVVAMSSPVQQNKSGIGMEERFGIPSLLDEFGIMGLAALYAPDVASGHRCETCGKEKYANCQLPFKKQSRRYADEQAAAGSVN